MRSSRIVVAIALTAIARTAGAQVFDVRAKQLTFTPSGAGLYDVGILWEFGVIGTAPTQDFDIELRVNGTIVESVRYRLTRLSGSAMCDDAGPPCLGPCPPYRISINPFTGDEEWDWNGDCSAAPKFTIDDPDSCWCLYDDTALCSEIASVPIPPGALCSVRLDAQNELPEASESNNVVSAFLSASVPAMPAWAVSVLALSVLIAGSLCIRQGTSRRA